MAQLGEMDVRASALVLAGGLAGADLHAYTGVRNKALIDINGKPMLRYVVDALTEAEHVDEIVVIGPPEELGPALAGLPVTVVPDTGNMIDNIRAGAAHVAHNRPMLISSSDIPLLTGPVVDAFLELCFKRPADLYYSIVEREVNERKYPLVKRTYVSLAEGTFTGGNLFMVDPAIVEPVAPKAREFIANRKRPLRMARLLGLGFLIKLLLRVLSIPELEAKIGKLWGVRGAAIICPYPEIGIDVDKPDDVQLVRAALR